VFAGLYGPSLSHEHVAAGYTIAAFFLLGLFFLRLMDQAF
jgi:hypothetical protein